MAIYHKPWMDVCKIDKQVKKNQFWKKKKNHSIKCSDYKFQYETFFFFFRQTPNWDFLKQFFVAVERPYCIKSKEKEDLKKKKLWVKHLTLGYLLSMSAMGVMFFARVYLFYLLAPSLKEV